MKSFRRIYRVISLAAAWSFICRYFRGMQYIKSYDISAFQIFRMFFGGLFLEESCFDLVRVVQESVPYMVIIFGMAQLMQEYQKNFVYLFPRTKNKEKIICKIYRDTLYAVLAFQAINIFTYLVLVCVMHVPIQQQLSDYILVLAMNTLQILCYAYVSEVCALYWKAEIAGIVVYGWYLVQIVLAGSVTNAFFVKLLPQSWGTYNYFHIMRLMDNYGFEDCMYAVQCQQTGLVLLQFMMLIFVAGAGYYKIRRYECL